MYSMLGRQSNAVGGMEEVEMSQDSVGKNGKKKDLVPGFSKGEMEAVISECSDARGGWKVEAVRVGDGGEPMVAIFFGPQAHERASEYASAKFIAVLE
jgi:hypothetical protein